MTDASDNYSSSPPGASPGSIDRELGALQADMKHLGAGIEKLDSSIERLTESQASQRIQQEQTNAILERIAKGLELTDEKLVQAIKDNSDRFHQGERRMDAHEEKLAALEAKPQQPLTLAGFMAQCAEKAGKIVVTAVIVALITWGAMQAFGGIDEITHQTAPTPGNLPLP